MIHRKLGLLLSRALMFSGLALALSCIPANAVTFSAMHTLGFQRLTSLASATSLTVPNGSMEAFIICTGQTVNWRDDGTAPTSSIGMPLLVNTPFPYTAGNMSQIQIIQTAASATCNITYYGL
jgi:hypothetical protein